MRKDKQGMYVKVISESYWEKKECDVCFDHWTKTELLNIILKLLLETLLKHNEETI